MQAGKQTRKPSQVSEVHYRNNRAHLLPERERHATTRGGFISSSVGAPAPTTKPSAAWMGEHESAGINAGRQASKQMEVETHRFVSDAQDPNDGAHLPSAIVSVMH